MTLVFVYGSLLKDLSNHHIFFRAGTAKFISRGMTLETGRFYLTARGDLEYPYMTEDPFDESQNPRRVFGEIYEVNDRCLYEALDVLEEYPEYFDRRKIEIISETAEETTISCFAYFLVSASIIDRIKSSFGVDYFDVPNGDWRQYRLEKTEIEKKKGGSD